MATAPIGPLAWEPPCAVGMALKKQKQKTKEQKTLLCTLKKSGKGLGERFPNCQQQCQQKGLFCPSSYEPLSSPRLFIYLFTYLLTNSLIFFFGRPTAYGVPEPGIRSEPQSHLRRQSCCTTAGTPGEPLCCLDRVDLFLLEIPLHSQVFQKFFCDAELFQFCLLPPFFFSFYSHT